MTAATLIRTAYRPLKNNGIADGGDYLLRMNLTTSTGRENGIHVRGGPDWVRSDKYTISAVADGAADAPTLQGPMLWSLLERRFQLKVHVETEEVDVYELQIAKGGLKLKPAAPGSCVARDLSSPMDGAAPRRMMEAVRGGAPPWCGQTFLTSGPNMTSVGGRMPLGSIVRFLNISATYSPVALDGLLVVDKTGIPDSELFNFFLEFAADPNADGASAPSVFSALEQVGLHLQRAKGPREFIVIDHIERPSPN
jgi:uncharacterized protein (TIGR03435 family)